MSGGAAVAAYPNPSGLDIYSALADGRPTDEEIGDLDDAARVAGVEPGTIRTWMSRGKIEPLVHRDDGGYLFHLPTIAAAAAAGAPHRVADPGASRRGRGRRRQPAA
jgi:hypothetical protein